MAHNKLHGKVLKGSILCVDIINDESIPKPPPQRALELTCDTFIIQTIQNGIDRMITIVPNTPNNNDNNNHDKINTNRNNQSVCFGFYLFSIYYIYTQPYNVLIT